MPVLVGGKVDGILSPIILMLLGLWSEMYCMEQGGVGFQSLSNLSHGGKKAALEWVLYFTVFFVVRFPFL